MELQFIFSLMFYLLVGALVLYELFVLCFPSYLVTTMILHSDKKTRKKIEGKPWANLLPDERNYVVMRSIQAVYALATVIGLFSDYTLVFLAVLLISFLGSVLPNVVTRTRAFSRLDAALCALLLGLVFFEGLSKLAATPNTWELLVLN